MLEVKLFGLGLYSVLLYFLHQFKKRYADKNSVERRKLDQIPYASTFLKYALPILYAFFIFGFVIALLMVLAETYGK